MTILSNYNGDIDCWRKMQFNSVKRGNFSGLARSVSKSAAQAFDAARSTATDHTAIAKEAIKGRSMERRAVMKAEGKVARAGLEAVSKTKQYKDTADMIVDVGEEKGKKARMAGALGALGSLATGVTTRKYLDRQEEREAERDKERLAWRERVLTAMSRPGEKPPKIEYPDLIDPNIKPPSSDNGSSGSGDSSATVPTTYQSQSIAGSTDLSKLTDDDFNHLAFAISSEAGPGKDRYGVAASILNRVASDKWPGTVKNVIYQDGQYEGVYTGRSRQRPDIAADLSSDTGRAEILKALKVLDGRTDFKGQTMLSNRSNKGNKDYDGDGIPDLDPMFNPKGNFFHYSHQTNML